MSATRQTRTSDATNRKPRRHRVAGKHLIQQYATAASVGSRIYSSSGESTCLTAKLRLRIEAQKA